MKNKKIMKVMSGMLAAMMAVSSISAVNAKGDDAAELTAVYDGGTGWGELIRNAGTIDPDTAYTKEETADVNIRASVEGMVLLENRNHALP